MVRLKRLRTELVDRDSSAGIATRYGLEIIGVTVQNLVFRVTMLVIFAPFVPWIQRRNLLFPEYSVGISGSLGKDGKNVAYFLLPNMSVVY